VGAELGIADFDGNGQLDLVTATTNDRLGTLYLGNGDGSFRAGQEYAIDGNGNALAVADLDGDHAPEVVVACGLSTLTPPGRMSVLMNQAFSLVGVEPSAPGVRAALTFERAFPSPGRSPLTLEFTMRTAGEARADLFDVAGRHVAGRSLGRVAAGPNRARLEAVAALRPGIYWVRVSAGAESATRKVVVAGN
jgi:hypothetical protein